MEAYMVRQMCPNGCGLVDFQLQIGGMVRICAECSLTFTIKEITEYQDRGLEEFEFESDVDGCVEIFALCRFCQTVGPMTFLESWEDNSDGDVMVYCDACRRTARADDLIESRVLERPSWTGRWTGCYVCGAEYPPNHQACENCGVGVKTESNVFSACETCGNVNTVHLGIDDMSSGGSISLYHDFLCLSCGDRTRVDLEVCPHCNERGCELAPLLGGTFYCAVCDEDFIPECDVGVGRSGADSALHQNWDSGWGDADYWGHQGTGWHYSSYKVRTFEESLKERFLVHESI